MTDCTCPSRGESPHSMDCPAAPETPRGELREALAYAISDSGVESLDAAWRLADAVLALPALRDLLAERDTLAAQVRAVEGEIGLMQDVAAGGQDIPFRTPRDVTRMWSNRIRRALGTPTTGGGE